MHLSHLSTYKNLFKKLRMACIIFWVTSIYTIHAEPLNAPVEVIAGYALIKEQQGTAHYKKNVSITQDGLLIEADEVLLENKNGKLYKITAEGNKNNRAHFIQQALTSNSHQTNYDETVTASARIIIYYLSEQRLELKEDATLLQQGKTFSGAHIDYDIEKRKVNASSSATQRVELIFPAKTSNQATPNNDEKLNTATIYNADQPESSTTAEQNK